MATLLPQEVDQIVLLHLRPRIFPAVVRGAVEDDDADVGGAGGIASGLGLFSLMKSSAGHANTPTLLGRRLRLLRRARGESRGGLAPAGSIRKPLGLGGEPGAELQRLSAEASLLASKQMKSESEMSLAKFE